MPRNFFFKIITSAVILGHSPTFGSLTSLAEIDIESGSKTRANSPELVPIYESPIEKLICDKDINFVNGWTKGIITHVSIFGHSPTFSSLTYLANIDIKKGNTIKVNSPELVPIYEAIDHILHLEESQRENEYVHLDKVAKKCREKKILENSTGEELIPASLPLTTSALTISGNTVEVNLHTLFLYYQRLQSIGRSLFEKVRRDSIWVVGRLNDSINPFYSVIENNGAVAIEGDPDSPSDFWTPLGKLPIRGSRHYTLDASESILLEGYSLTLFATEKHSFWNGHGPVWQLNSSNGAPKVDVIWPTDRLTIEEANRIWNLVKPSIRD